MARVVGSIVGFFTVAAASKAGTDCLLWHGHGGCEAIRNEAECLSSRDGRPWAKWDGLLIAGQPCSWCGGENCADNSDSLCMPHDWVKHRVNISTANCAQVDHVEPPSDDLVSSSDDLHVEAASDDPQFEDAAMGTTCGADRLEESEHYNRYYWTFSVASALRCKAICASKDYCTGFGFEAYSKVCKIWWHPISLTVLSSNGDDQCVKVVDKALTTELAETTPAATTSTQMEIQVMKQEEDDPNATAVGAVAPSGLSDEDKGAIAGGVVGGVAAAGLLGGLLGGLLPSGGGNTTTTMLAPGGGAGGVGESTSTTLLVPGGPGGTVKTTTMMDTIIRMLPDGESFDNDTNDTGAPFFGKDQGALPVWAAWWTLAALVLAVLACLGLWLLWRRGSSEEEEEEHDFSDEESLASPRMAAAETRPVLLSRAAAAPNEVPKAAAPAGALVEPAGMPLMAGLLHASGAPRSAYAVPGSARGMPPGVMSARSAASRRLDDFVEPTALP